MSRISQTFERLRREGRAGIVIYLTVGYPDLDSTVSLAQAALAGGADILELGVPFSDPLADGATIQRSSAAALEKGINLEACLETVRRLRSSGATAPLLLMGYYNPFLHYGPGRLAAMAESVGLDGFLVPDLPPEEAEILDGSLRAKGLDLAYFLAPTSTDARIEAVARRARGFIYCVSLTGVTGARSALSPRAQELLQRVRQHSKLPLVIGFGISGPEHVRSLAPFSDGVVVASALIDLVDRTPSPDQPRAVQTFVGSLVAAARVTPRLASGPEH